MQCNTLLVVLIYKSWGFHPLWQASLLCVPLQPWWQRDRAKLARKSSGCRTRLESEEELDQNDQDCLQVPVDLPVGKHATWETKHVLVDKESVMEEEDENRNTQTTPLPLKRWRRRLDHPRRE